MHITTALDRHLNQADSAYESDKGFETTPRDEQTYLEREIAYIVRHLESGNHLDSLVSPEQWNDRLTECKGRLRRLLEQEASTLKATSQLHCEGLIKIHLRQLELEAELRELEVAQ